MSDHVKSRQNKPLEVPPSPRKSCGVLFVVVFCCCWWWWCSFFVFLQNSIPRPALSSSLSALPRRNQPEPGWGGGREGAGGGRGGCCLPPVDRCPSPVPAQFIPGPWPHTRVGRPPAKRCLCTPPPPPRRAAVRYRLVMEAAGRARPQRSFTFLLPLPRSGKWKLNGGAGAAALWRGRWEMRQHRPGRPRCCCAPRGGLGCAGLGALRGDREPGEGRSCSWSCGNG